MCRIAGILNQTIGTAILEKVVKAMCDLLQHGGPDDEGLFTSAEDNLVLGNRRLSLLDLSAAGHQPMQFNGRYTITFNGELYNFVALKNELLAAGVQFKTGTDTEVILAAFAQWNTQSFARLNGMFAFALWDDEEKMLFLVRDKAGIKPLYYATHSNGLAFASEVQAFSPIAYLQETNEAAKVYQLAYGYLPEPITTLAHVKPLPKGCYIAYNAQTHLHSLQSFSFFSFSNSIKEEGIAKQSVFIGLSGAVRRQMIADAPIGVFLSGGIDSAIIAKLVNNKDQKDLHTLSIYFNEKKYSEKQYQDIIASNLKSTHHAVLLQEANFHTHFPEIIQSMDLPTCDGINTWFISKFAAAEGLKAVLSGVGADELFGGYPSFNRIGKAMLLQKMPDLALHFSSKASAQKYDRISYLQIEGMRGLYLFLRGHFAPVQIAKQLGGYEKETWQMLHDFPTSPKLELEGPKNVASWMEFNMYMQDQLLRDADVMGMAHGLEIRVPFLDDEVIHSAFAMDEKIKFKGKIPKQLLIESFENILSKEIWDRPKMGFSFPFAEWMRNSVLLRELEQSNNIHTKKACKDFMNGKLHWSRIMSLIVLKNKISEKREVNSMF